MTPEVHVVLIADETGAVREVPVPVNPDGSFPALDTGAAWPDGVRRWPGACEHCDAGTRDVADIRLLVAGELVQESRACVECVHDFAEGCGVMGGTLLVRCHTGWHELAAPRPA